MKKKLINRVKAWVTDNELSHPASICGGLIVVSGIVLYWDLFNEAYITSSFLGLGLFTIYIIILSSLFIYYAHK